MHLQARREANSLYDFNLVLYAVPTLCEIKNSDRMNKEKTIEKNIDDCVELIIQKINNYKNNFYCSDENYVFTGIVYHLNGIEGKVFVRENSLDFLLKIDKVDKKDLTNKFFNIEHNKKYIFDLGISKLAIKVLEAVKHGIVKNTQSFEEQEDFVYKMFIDPEFCKKFLEGVKENLKDKKDDFDLNKNSFFGRYGNYKSKFYDPRVYGSSYLKQEYIRGLMMFVILSEIFKDPKKKGFEEKKRIDYILPRNHDSANEFFGFVLRLNQKEIQSLKNENFLKSGLEVNYLKNPSHSSKKEELFYLPR